MTDGTVSRRAGRRGRCRVAALAAAGALSLLAGCSRFNPNAFQDSDALYQASMREFRHGRFGRAQAGFQKLGFELSPRDSLFTVVRFHLAETYFGLRDYVTAAREFRRVSDEAPDSPLAPVALLRSGDSHAQLWRRPAVDPTSGQTALATWQELQGRYPESNASEISFVRVRALNEQFATKDFETADFYYRRGGYDSAILYFRSLISTYPSSSLVPEAFVRLVRAYRAIGYREEQQETCQHLRQYYPTRADVREVCGDRDPGR